MTPIEIISLCIAGIAAIGTACAAFVAWITYRNSKKPDVIIYLDRPEDSSAIWFYVKNIGKSVAYNINFSVGNLPVNICEKVFSDFSDFGLKMLGPDCIRKYPVLNPPLDQDKKDVYMCNVTYEEKYHFFGLRYRQYEADFPLDYYSFSKTLYTDTEEMKSRKALEKIAKNTAK